jgi:hypothetical protein
VNGCKSLLSLQGDSRGPFPYAFSVSRHTTPTTVFAGHDCDNDPTEDLLAVEKRHGKTAAHFTGSTTDALSYVR